MSLEDRDGWTRARLIPTVGIRGQDEQEKRATSSLLAVMHAVPEFAHALLKPLGAPKGTVTTYTEVQFKDADGKTHIPDGAIVVERGKTRWSCLVEVKTSGAALKADQVSRYLDVARTNGIDAVWTISNDITSDATHSPVVVDKRKLRTVALVHRSWWRILTEAIVQHRHRGISDPDQAWLLGELITYLDDERSGASGFSDMGENWVAVRNGAGDRTLRHTAPDVRDVADRWGQFGEYLCLHLGQDLGAEVRIVRPRSQTPEAAVDLQARSLADSGQLNMAVRVPDAAGDLLICADLHAKKVTCAVELDAPGDGRPATRVKWLTRQLKDAPASLIVEASFVQVRTTNACRLADLREDPARILLDGDPKRPPRTFKLTLAGPMGSKRGKGERSFVLETRRQATGFYRDIVQDLTVWQARAPKLPDDEDPEEPDVAPNDT